ncbi:hypothetical protein NDU88_003934 [Pleurodeles waltl]|uniref:Uncharacterized protein n=1 Tax=Pleurodeles waltl TaxID=8319 RepID=A0AAV7T872_PLEWA|nr:hypothetical protein NDU88_003934 [Pleurodeles waltl]
MGKLTRKRDVVDLGGSTAPRHRSGESRTTVSSRSWPMETTLVTILQTIAASWEALELKIDTIASDLGILRDYYCRLSDRVTTIDKV